MSFKDFLIESAHKWAIGKNKDMAIKSQEHRDDFMIIWVKPSDLIDNTDPEMRVSPESKENHIGSRMQKAIDHLESDGWMDPPIIAYDHYTTGDFKIIIDDGRHRIAALKKLGTERIPAFIMKNDLPFIKKIIDVKLK